MIESHRCPRCDTVKPASEFNRNLSTKSGLQTWCRTCARIRTPERRARDIAASKARRDANPERERERTRAYRLEHLAEESARAVARRRTKTYGLAPGRWEAMLVQQHGRCAVCEREFVAEPHVDHDRSCCPGRTSCGKCVRSLLCANCNKALGLFYEDTKILARAISYLERPR